MGLVSTFFATLVCLLCILVNVDSNSLHSPNDRPRHARSHNLHRAPYEGFDWDLQGYERNFDPMPAVRKG